MRAFQQSLFRNQQLKEESKSEPKLNTDLNAKETSDSEVWRAVYYENAESRLGFEHRRVMRTSKLQQKQLPPPNKSDLQNVTRGRVKHHLHPKTPTQVSTPSPSRYQLEPAHSKAATTSSCASPRNASASATPQAWRTYDQHAALFDSYATAIQHRVCLHLH